MRSLFVALVSLVLATVASAALAQGMAAPDPSEAPPEGTFYYHWETPERLLLWQDLDQLVSVTVELRNGKWLPEDKKGLLKHLGEETRKQYPESDRVVVQKQWEVSLNAALRRSGGNYKQWLEPLRLPNSPTPGFIPRQPDVMIYLHVDTAEKKARIRLLSGITPVGSQAYEILQKTEGQKTAWMTSGIPIETAMGVKWRSTPILEIVGLQGTWPTDFWSALVDAWKVLPVGSHRQQLYETRQGKTAWAWFELVDAQGWLRLLGTTGPMRIMPTLTLAPAVSFKVPQVLQPSSETQTWAVDEGKALVLLLFVQTWLSSALALTAFLAIKRHLVSSPDSHTERSRQSSIDVENAQASSDFKRLREIVAVFHSRYRKWRQTVNTLKKQLTTLKKQFQSLQQELDDVRSKHTEAEKNLRLEIQTCGVRIEGLQKSLGQSEASQRSLTSDLAQTRQEISTLKKQQSMLTKQRDSLQQELADAKSKNTRDEKTHRQEIQASEARIEELQKGFEKSENSQRSLTSDLAKTREEISKLQGQLTTLTKQRDSLREDLDEASRKRTQAEKTLGLEIETWKIAEADTRQKLGVSEQAAQRLKEELNTARTESGALRETLQNLGHAAQRLEALGAVNAVSPFLRRGQNEFLNETDVQSAGLLAFLITHSLNQLALSRAFSQETKASAMLRNLHNIASRLAARYPGFLQVLPRLQELGADNSPLADNLIAVSAQHEDSKLFQLILKQLRTAHRIDLAPFYFDVTKDGQVVRAN